jgi:L-asparaginase II
MPDAVSDPLVFRVHRSGLRESSHRVSVAITRDGGLLRSYGDVDVPVFLRSAAKPIQTLPLVASGAAEAFSLDDGEIAIACGSHSGTPDHCRTVASMLRKGDLSPSLLACGIHPPIDPESADDSRRLGDP